MVVILRHNTFVYIDSFHHGGGSASKLCLFPANVVVFSARTFVKSILLVLTVDQNAVLPLVGTLYVARDNIIDQLRVTVYIFSYLSSTLGATIITLV